MPSAIALAMLGTLATTLDLSATCRRSFMASLARSWPFWIARTVASCFVEAITHCVRSSTCCQSLENRSDLHVVVRGFRYARAKEVDKVQPANTDLPVQGT
jgi:hypothetical protein